VPNPFFPHLSQTPSVMAMTGSYAKGVVLETQAICNKAQSLLSKDGDGLDEQRVPALPVCTQLLPLARGRFLWRSHLQSMNHTALPFVCFP
jgi:hypothetical protein